MSSLLITRRDAMSLAVSATAAVSVLASAEAHAAVAGTGKVPPQLDRYIRNYMPAMNAPGLTLGITSAQSTLHTAAYGYADIAAKIPATPTHLFEIGSITKSFVGVLVLQLHQEGKVDLHQPILHYLPWLSMQTDLGEVTVHHLLTHSSGMPGDLSVFPATRGARPQQTFKPGTKFHYCNWGYDVLGYLIEKVDGRSWSAALTERVLKPLGMTSTFPIIASDSRARLIQSYMPLHDDRPYPRQGPLAPAGKLTVTTAAGCIASTPADMSLYMKMLLNRGAGPSSRILSEESFKLFSTPHIAADEFGNDAYYGYGVAVDKFEGHTRLRHTGGMASFMSSMQLDLDAGIGAFASINAQLGYRPNPVTQYALQLLRAKNEQKAAPPAPAPDEALVVARPDDYAGVYTGADGRKLEIRATKDALVLRANGKDIKLQQSGGDEFIADDAAFALFPLAFGRAPQAEGQTPDSKTPPVVIELSYGSDWYGHSRHSGSAAPVPLPAEFAAYPGQYYAESPWYDNVRVVQRQGQLWLNGTAPLVQCGDGLFRVGTDPELPETAEFLHVIEGKAQVMSFGGMQFRRTSNEAV
jgi:D-alanyl-D-alanine carboxypeptidase